MWHNEDHSLSPAEFSGTARLFPLPHLVMFPQVMQPLHVFEPRYRDLVEDALGGDRLIALATLAPGWESDYEGRPPLEPMACLGRIVVHHRLEGGQYNLLLLGLHRIRLVEELPPTKAYREARVELHQDHYPSEQAAMSTQLQHKLQDGLVRLLADLPQAHDHLDQLLASDVSLGTLTDMISYVVDIGSEAKLHLLAERNVYRRAAALLEHLDAAASDLSPGRQGSYPFPPGFSDN